MGKAAEGIAVFRGTMRESLDFVFERANSALITQDFEYAERLLTKVLKKHPNVSPDDKEKIENLLARIYGDKGELERSLAAYLRLYEREPDNVELMLNLGRIYRHLGRYEDSLEILKKAQKIGGDTDEVLYNFAKTYKRMGNYGKSADYFSRAIEIKPDHAHAYDRLGNLYVLTGETDKAIEIYKQGLQVDTNHPYLNFHLAGLLRQEKRYEEAIVYYNSALRVNPAWAEALSGAASVYLKLNKLDDALIAYRSLLRVTGETAPLYTKIGGLFEKKQLQNEAEQYYYEALAIDSEYAPAALALTRLLEKKQQYNKALSILLGAEAAAVNAGNHALRLKAIQMCMYAKDYAKAHELFGRLDKEHSNSLNALKLRGQLYALTGAYEQAEETFKRILKMAPSAIEFHQELAEQYLLAHKYEEAKEQLKLFLKQKPNDISALMALGKTEELLNNPQAAYQEYQKVLDLNPNVIEARSALSRLLQKRGDTLEALKTANDILNLQSGFEMDAHEQDLAASLDLYEQAAESYIADPLVTKNLEQLKSDDSHLYNSSLEVNPEQDQSIHSLQALSKSEPEAEPSFEMLVEEKDETKELTPELDDISIDSMQLEGEPRADRSSAADDGNFRAVDNEAFASPIDDVYLDSERTENKAPLGVDETVTVQHKRRDLLLDEALRERLQIFDTYGTTMGFLQDIISDIDKQLDENRYAQAVEVLAERIAENLKQKVPIQNKVQQEEELQEEQQLDEDSQISEEECESVSEDVSADEDNAQIAEMTDEEPTEAAEEEEAGAEELDDVPSEFNPEETIEQEAIAEITVDNDEEPAPEDSECEEEFEQNNNQTPFILDQEQQNLLWCHAKHRIKESPLLEQYLDTADPKQLAQLFLYLRDLFAYLPQEELDVFLNSSERIQIYYLIARLSGELGLKERANLIQQAGSAIDTSSPYNDAAVFKLLNYLRDLSIELPDDGLGTRVRQEFEELIANISSVLPDL